MIKQSYFHIFGPYDNIRADSGDHAVSGLGLRLLSNWDCGFESRRGHECLSLTNVVCRIGTALCDGPILRLGESHRMRMCLTVRSGAAMTSTPTMSKYNEVKTKIERKR